MGENKLAVTTIVNKYKTFFVTLPPQDVLTLLLPYHIENVREMQTYLTRIVRTPLTQVNPYVCCVSSLCTKAVTINRHFRRWPKSDSLIARRDVQTNGPILGALRAKGQSLIARLTPTFPCSALINHMEPATSGQHPLPGFGSWQAGDGSWADFDIRKDQSSEN
jgi:hypothetical protein